MNRSMRSNGHVQLNNFHVNLLINALKRVLLHAEEKCLFAEQLSSYLSNLST